MQVYYCFKALATKWMEPKKSTSECVFEMSRWSGWKSLKGQTLHYINLKWITSTKIRNSNQPQLIQTFDSIDQ